MMKLSVLLLTLILTNATFANENESLSFFSDRASVNSLQTNIQNLGSSEVFIRTQSVLEYFKVGKEPDSQNYLNDLKYIQTSAEISSVLKWFDPAQFTKRLMTLSQTEFSIFQDLDSKNTIDLSVHLGTTLTQPPLRKHSLRGLKIAIDPGHMGSAFWDKETGKYLSDGHGHVLSEGVLNLQTSLLLKNEFEKLGAIVYLTHDELKPVSSMDYKNFNLTPFALNELKDSTHQDWFQHLIASAPVGSQLNSNFENSSDFKKLFSESARSEYFIKREDLWKRTELIDQFDPDLVLIIHYDTSSSASGLNPKSPKQTKSFVFGSYEKTEFGSREARKYFARHLLDKNSWNESVSLSRAIVQKMHKNLNLDLPTSADSGSTQIEPGIFARNLMVPRRLKSSVPVAYLECLFYDRTDEYQKLIQQDHSLNVGGTPLPYSNRVSEIANTIRDGVIDYVQ